MSEGNGRALGLRWESPEPEVKEPAGHLATNTRTSLWPERWPAIAKQECIDIVEAAPVQERPEVKFNLPCIDCEMKTACLNAKRKEVGPLLYDRELLTQPRSSESTLFPMAVFAPMLRKDMSLVPYWLPPFSLEHEWKVVQAWDIAWSEKVGGDWLVCETARVHLPSGHRHMLEIQRWQRVGFDEQCKLIETKHRQFSSDLVVIEDDAAQRVWHRHMAANTSVPVLPHGASGKTDLASGVPGLLILLANRKWTFPYRRGSHMHEEMRNMFNEFAAFSWVDGKLEGVGEHDDTVMCFWHLNWGIDRMLMHTSPNEQRRGNVPGARQ